MPTQKTVPMDATEPAPPSVINASLRRAGEINPFGVSPEPDRKTISKTAKTKTITSTAVEHRRHDFATEDPPTVPATTSSSGESWEATRGRAVMENM